MIRKLLVVSLLALACSAASADMRTVVRAYEIGLADFRAPVSDTGTAGIRTCQECAPRALRVTARTRYSVNGDAVDLREFRRLLLQTAKRNRAAVLVMHDLDENVVTSIALSHG